MTYNINFTKPAISYAKLACWPFVLEMHWLLSSHIWSFIYSSWKKVGHQITDLYQWGRRDSGAPRGHESNQMKIKRGSWIITVKKNSHMEAIFPLRAQTQYWISLEAFFCVWNLSPISPPDTDDFHRAAGETACAGVCPLCGKRGKSALIGFYIHVRQRGCSRSSQRRVTPTKRGELRVLLLCVIGLCSWLTRRLACSGAENSSWAFCFSVSFEALTPKFQWKEIRMQSQG